MRRAVWAWAIWLGVALATDAGAQTIRWKSVPLEQALTEFAEAADVDLVFAHRLVRGRRTSAAWTPGEDPAAGLADLLEGTRLRAERIRARQFVIIAEPINVVVEPGDPAAYTGRLEGRILDAETGLALEGAHVFLVDLGLGGIAGADGSFSVPGLPTGQYTVQFSYVGYRSVRLQMDVYPETSLLPPTVRLRPEPFTLSGAVVRPGSEPSSGAGSIDVASDLSPSARQAAVLPLSTALGDLWHVLDWLPGVTRAPGGGAGLAVRGFDPSLVRTYRDGAPVLEPAGPSGISGLFQREALRGVRLHRGTPPAELVGGTGGVLEVEPDDGRGRARATGVAALGPLASRFVVRGPLTGRSGFLVAGRRSFPGLGYPVDPAASRTAQALVIDPLGGPGRQNGHRAPADYSYQDADASLSVAFTDRQRFSIGGWLATDRVSVDRDVTAHGSRSTGVVSARHRALIGETFLAATAYASRYAADELVRDSAGRVRDYDVRLLETGLRLDGDHYLSADHTIRAGLSFARRSLNANLTDIEWSDRARQGASETAIWFMDIWRPIEGWQIETGVRGEAFDGRPYLSPRVLARWTIVRDQLYARAGAGRQLEGLLRLPDPGAATPARLASRWLIADGDAPPASVWQAGVGAESTPLPGFAVSADLFARRADDLPEPRSDLATVGNVVSRDSIGVAYDRADGRAMGIELAARMEGGPWLLGATYTLSRSEVRPAGLAGDTTGDWQRARHDRPHSMGLIVQRDMGRWHAAARLDLMARAPRADEEAVRIDLAAGYRFQAAGADWIVQVQAEPTAGRGDRAVMPGLPPASDGPRPLAFAADGATMPVWPTFTVRATW